MTFSKLLVRQTGKASPKFLLSMASSWCSPAGRVRRLAPSVTAEAKRNLNPCFPLSSFFRPDFVGIFERKLDIELEIGLLGTFLLKETLAKYYQRNVRDVLDSTIFDALQTWSGVVSVMWRDPSCGRGHMYGAWRREFLIGVEIILGKVVLQSVLLVYPSHATSSRIHKLLWKCTMDFNLIQIYIAACFYSYSKLTILWSTFLGNVFTRGKTSSRTLRI